MELVLYSNGLHLNLSSKRCVVSIGRSLCVVFTGGSMFKKQTLDDHRTLQMHPDSTSSKAVCWYNIRIFKHVLFESVICFPTAKLISLCTKINLIIIYLFCKPCPNQVTCETEFRPNQLICEFMLKAIITL